MPNIASVLKSEISRLARKEIRAEVEGLRKLAISQRTQIASLRREVEALARQMKHMDKRTSASKSTEEATTPSRYSARSVAAQRRRLALTAREYGLLVGVSASTVYLWERGETHPRQKQLDAVFSVRGLTKAQADERLAAMQ